MDWANLVADETMLLDKHFTPGRAGRSIDKVVLHHNGGRLTIRGCYDVWQTREASAHYQVEAGGRIGQLVNDWDTAWHAGDQDANQTSIGIEHCNDQLAPQWTIGEATLDAGAHLVAALCRGYNLGRPEWGRNVFGHRDFYGTECPGAIYTGQRDAYMARAQMYYDQMAGGAGAPAAAAQAPAPAPAPAPARPRVSFPPFPWGLNSGNYLGDINGPAQSHGGYYEAERPLVRAVQQALIVGGYVPGVTDPNSNWADGIWEQPTTDAMTAFQRDHMPHTTYWGQCWADDYARLVELYG